jgi:hypothetical protein
MEPTTEGRGASTSMLYKLLYTQSLLKLKSYRILILTKNKTIMKNSMSPEDFNSMACDIANDYAQARQEMCAEDFQEWEAYLAERLGEEPDTSGPVHSDKDAICCYCGSDKEPNVTAYAYKEGWIQVDGYYYDCECRSIHTAHINTAYIAKCNQMIDDGDLPF